MKIPVYINFRSKLCFKSTVLLEYHLLESEVFGWYNELTESEEKPLFWLSVKQAGWDFTIRFFQKYALNKFIARLPLTWGYFSWDRLFAIVLTAVWPFLTDSVRRSDLPRVALKGIEMSTFFKLKHIKTSHQWWLGLAEVALPAIFVLRPGYRLFYFTTYGTPLQCYSNEVCQRQSKI
jgi:hypothetical protein